MTDPFTPPSGEQPPAPSGQPLYGEPPPPQYGAAQYGAPYAAPGATRNGFGVTALVLGILAVPGAFLIIPGIALGALAILFGLLGRRRVTRQEANNGGVALAGLITGAVGLVLAAGLLIAGIAFLNSDGGKKLQDCLDRAETQTQQDECAAQFGRDIRGS